MPNQDDYTETSPLFSRCAANGRGVEVRFEVDPEELSVLDGYCQGYDTTRVAVFRSLLKEWSQRQVHGATVLLRVAGRNPGVSELDRKVSA